MREPRIGARVKAKTELGFGSVPKGTLGTVTHLYTDGKGKPHIVVQWDNDVTNQWVQSSFERWMSEAPATTEK